MAWQKSTTTKHTCGGPVFGKRTAGCKRCDELTNGAAPVKWRCDDTSAVKSIRNHNCATSNCGPVCTFGEW
jgi:hypothetical protein